MSLETMGSCFLTEGGKLTIFDENNQNSLLIEKSKRQATRKIRKDDVYEEGLDKETLIEVSANL